VEGGRRQHAALEGGRRQLQLAAAKGGHHQLAKAEGDRRRASMLQPGRPHEHEEAGDAAAAEPEAGRPVSTSTSSRFREESSTKSFIRRRVLVS
jgi:hypothetical protein